MYNEKYTIGVDIGNASTGIAVLDNENQKILTTHVYIFDIAASAKTRRMKRSNRRRYRRRAGRLNAVKTLLNATNLISATKSIPNICNYKLGALSSRVTPSGLAQIILHSVGHRGYDDVTRNGRRQDEGGSVTLALSSNKNLHGFRTPSECIIKHKAWGIPNKHRNTCKNIIVKAGNKSTPIVYEKMFTISQYVEELRLIFEKQREFGNPLATQSIEEEVIDIMTSYHKGRDYKEMVGDCSYVVGELRAPKDAYSIIVNNAIAELQNLISEDGEILSSESIEQLITQAHNKVITLGDIKQYMGIDKASNFNNYDRQNDTKIINFKVVYDLKSLLTPKEFEWFMEDTKRIDQMVECLVYYCSDEKIREELKKYNIPFNIIEKIINLNYSKVSHKSFTAVYKLNPLMLSGKSLYDALNELGYNKIGSNLNNFYIKAINNENILNPVARRGVAKAIKYINAHMRDIIVDDPDATFNIIIELARDFSKSKDDLAEYNALTKKPYDNYINKLKTEHVRLGGSGKGKAFNRFRLWKEQNEREVYTGDIIKFNDIDSGRYEIDHITPQAIGGGDGQGNKVLTELNRLKSDKTPYQLLGSNQIEWDNFKNRVVTMFNRDHKAGTILKSIFNSRSRNLLSKTIPKQTFGMEDLCATQYVGKFLINHIKTTTRHKVSVTNGRVTAQLRKWFGFNKDRGVHDHHAVDALMITLSNPKVYNMVLGYYREGKYVDDRFDDVALWPGFKQQAKKILNNVIYIREEIKRVEGKLHEEKSRRPIRSLLNTKVTKLNKKGNRVLNAGGVKGVTYAKFAKKHSDQIEKIIGMVDDHGILRKFNPNTVNDDDLLLFEHNAVQLDNGTYIPGNNYRLDVFRKSGKYYFVNITLFNYVNSMKPYNKICSSGLPEALWVDVDDTYEFICTLYRNSLFSYKDKKDSGIYYYSGFNIANGTLVLFNYSNNDNLSPDKKGILAKGFVTAKRITKLYISPLGKINVNHKEVRKWHGEPC